MSAKKVLLALLGLFVVGVVVAAVLVATYVPRWIEERVVAEARRRGIELTPGELSFGVGWVQLADSRLALVGVRKVHADVGLIDAKLDGLTPLAFTLSRVRAEIVGDPALLLAQLEAWDRAHAPALREPAAIEGLSVVLREKDKAAPQATLDGAKARLESGRLFVQAKNATALGKNLGELRVLREKQLLRADFTLGHGSLDNPTVSVETLDEADRKIHVGLSPLRLGELSKALGVELPLPDVLASGTLDVTVPRNLSVGARIRGRGDLVLKGWVPPHPVELDGFVFGDVTRAGGAFTVEPELLRVRIDEASVEAGKFRLRGGGALVLEGDHGRIQLGLTGALSCPDLASAAAPTRLGQALGRVAGKAARQVLSGSVGVRVSIDADTRDLAKARVLKTITAGCGLRPLTLKELIALGELVPETLDPRVAKDFEALLEKGLPPLPPGVNLEIKVPNLGSLPLPVLPGEPRGTGGRAPR